MLSLSDAARDDLLLVQSASDDALRTLCLGALRCLHNYEAHDDAVASVAAGA